MVTQHCLPHCDSASCPADTDQAVPGMVQPPSSAGMKRVMDMLKICCAPILHNHQNFQLNFFSIFTASDLFLNCFTM